MPDHITLACDSLSDAVLVGFKSSEGLSRCYHVDVFVTLADVGPLDGVLGQKLSLFVEAEPRYGLHGIVAEVELLEELVERSVARLRVVPRLWQLGLSRHSRMFTQKKVPEILEAVLSDAGLAKGTDFELRLSGSYSAEEHVCQYRESDLAFLSRWMEHEGMHYFFEHDGDVERLVISDDSTNPGSLDATAVRYVPALEARQREARGFRRFTSARRARPSKVKLADYDYAKPSLDVSGEAPALDGGFGEIVRFGAERFFDPGRGKALASVRADALLALQAPSHGEGRAYHLRSGYAFELSLHPVAALNRKYLCVTLEQRANVRATTPELAALTGLVLDDPFSVTVVATDPARPFRPALVTPKPRVAGYVTGVVDGPADSDYAQLDADGRYRVILHFDESGLADGKASTTVRMLQPHAGNPEGMHFPLRKGTEVLIDFLDGDPDRPLIAGAVPNAHNPSTVTSANHTHNVVHTGGDNHFDFEDKADGQWIWFFSPTKKSYLHLGKPFQDRSHHITLHTDGNNLFDYGTNQDITVGGKLEETVDGAVEETYKANQTSLVMGNQTTHVTGATEETYGATQTTTTMGQVTETYQVPHNTTVNAAPRTEVFLASQSTTISGGGLTQHLNGSHTRTVVGATTSTLGGSYSRHVTGAVTELYGGPVTRIWGPNDATFASINMVVPGGVTCINLVREIKAPGDTWIELVRTHTISVERKCSFVNLAANILKVEGVGANIGTMGFKGSATSITIELNGFKKKVEGIKGVTKASEFLLHLFSVTA